MNVENAERIIHRWIVTRRPGQRAPARVRHAYTWADRKAKAKGPSVAPDLFNLVDLARDEIMQRGAGYSKRAGVRRDVAEYIEKTIFPENYDYKFLKIAEKLRAARKTGTWGTRPNGDLVTIWDDKSGLLRIDPDEAREETQRLAERYIPALIEKTKAGAGVHYAVFTLPNYDAGKLAKGQRDIYRKFSNLLRKQLDKKKLFPEIIGAIGVVEAPLAADGSSWNIHLNVILLTRSRFEVGLYEKLRRAWHWNVEIKPVKGDAGDMARSFRELIKYPVTAISEKSAAKAQHGRTPAPALTDWPAARFIEWYRAQHRFRRTRTYGELYGSKVPKPEPSSLDDVTWHGVVHCAPDRFFAQVPLIDLIPGDKSTIGARDRPATGPP